MAALSRKLQEQNSCRYWSQQSLPLYRYKKPEFLLGLVGSKTVLLSFLDKLLSKKSKQSYKCCISFLLVRWWRKSQLLSCEHSNPLLFVVFTNKCFNFRAPRHDFKLLASASGLNLQNLCFATVLAFLKYLPNQAR